jgi:site-specific DNA recombinase
MTTPRVVGYVRVSTEKQAEGGISLDAQTAKIRAMAVVKGVEVADILVDAGASAKSLGRPEMTRLLALIDARAVTTVIVAKLDRLTRSIRDLSDLLDRFERRGVSLVSVAESLDTRSSAGRLVIHILGSVAQWEREAIGERTREALQHKKAQGQRVGTLPFGFQLVKDSTTHLEPAPVEQRLLARFQALRAAGKTYEQIAAAVTAEGATTRRGTVYRHQYVARALRRA